MTCPGIENSAVSFMVLEAEEPKTKVSVENGMLVNFLSDLSERLQREDITELGN